MSVLDEIRAERARQDAKWGEQNHPMVDPILSGRGAHRYAEEHEIPTADRARAVCQIHAARGDVTYFHILIEEVAEALDAATRSEAEARAELVQCAAVAVAMIECIDRRAGGQP